ncbi:LacI family DNA-binding transcriptional regulator [Devosia rhodophyticola]|uniref:LacI family DNA-binding transcriptional regulator n=1 Tax=Devosia rhodophyticola TaxID=3026423 RepID=A0ABY7Z1B6_9HYPH|nr:LacI family DNA-binding transcriptional regulator [Devosia rhodophyticola]WDR07249.1 LacI family DNA-binding transcriptional regulator [Devosia rhodophyticola]
MADKNTDRPAPTMADVARAADVSKSTVSRAFTQPNMLGVETVDRILEVARLVGYVPNHAARALSTGRHGNVALVVPDVANPFFPPLIRAAQMEADRSNFCVFLGNSDESWRQEDKLVERFVSQVEGLALVASRLSEERIRHHAAKRPLVLINRDIRGIPRVLIDSSIGVNDAMAHLADLGHERLVYVSGPASSWANQQRRAAVRSGAKAYHMEVTIVAAKVPSYESGRAVVPDILASNATAVLAFDDLTAQGIMTGIADRGVSVPGQISIVGCDDVLGAATYPSLTTVSNRSDEAGRAGMSLLLDMLNSRAVGDACLVLDTHLVVRNTTAPKPNRAPRRPAGAD